MLARAVADFVTAHGALSLRGTLPDMFAAADGYLALQAVYKAKARADAALVAARVAELLAGIGRPAADVTRRFCASSAAAPWRSSTHPRRSTRPRLGAVVSVAFPRGRGLVCFLSSRRALSAEQALEADENSVAGWYLVLRAADAFYETHRYCPGACVRERVSASGRGPEGRRRLTHSLWLRGARRRPHCTEQLLDDVAEVQAFATGLQAQLGLAAAATVKPDTVHELCGRAQRVGLTYSVRKLDLVILDPHWIKAGK